MSGVVPRDGQGMAGDRSVGGRIALLVAASLLWGAGGPASANDCSSLARELRKDEKAVADASKRLAAHRKKGPTTRESLMKEEVLKSVVAVKQNHLRDTKARLRVAGC